MTNAEGGERRMVERALGVVTEVRQDENPGQAPARALPSSEPETAAA